MGSVGHDDGKIRAEKGAQAALLAFFHLLALRRKISLGVHLFGWLQHLGRAELDADPATFAVLLFYVKLRHNISISIFSATEYTENTEIRGKKLSLNFDGLAKNLVDRHPGESRGPEYFEIAGFRLPPE
jgi:hypothetical protein